ncbi:MAG: hypothetical protein AAGA17_02140 [Actinomycetota bacterium]
MTVVVGTDPADVDARGAAVVAPGVAAARRARLFRALAVVAHPADLPFATGCASMVRADGLFASAPAVQAPGRVTELFRVVRPGGTVVTSAQVDPGPVGSRRPIDAAALAELLPSSASVERLHDRTCRKDWRRLTSTT